MSENVLEGIAIVGISGRWPGAPTPDALWDVLARGVETVRLIPPEELETEEARERATSPSYVRARGVLEGVEMFDAAFFGIIPRDAELMDPQQRLFLECCWEALEDAGHDPSRVPGPVGVFAGQSLNTYLLQNLCSDRAFIERFTEEFQVGSYPVLLGNEKDFLTTRVSYKLDLHGPSIDLQCACSTSLVAVSFACQSLLTFSCDAALAGGVSISFPQKRGYRYLEGGMVSVDGHCRAFDENAQGTVFGAGCGVVVLKRLEDAVASGDHIYAVIKGTAVNNDGARKVGYTAPSVERQAEVIAMAHAVAGVAPGSIQYVETHGTGTPLGDPIEIEGLTRAFRSGSAKLPRRSCAIGSAKTNLGHLEVAAGVTGLIKTALALEHGQIPPSLHFQKPNPRIDFDAGPFYVNERLADWPAGPGPRRAGVSAFGVGGTNAHAVLEEGPRQSPSQPGLPAQLLVLSARTPAALEAASQRLAGHLEAHPEQALADVAFTLQEGRKAFAHRRALVATDAASAVAALRATTAKPAAAPEGSRPVAFLFPGQGSQSAGMGAELHRMLPRFRAELDRCLEILRPQLPHDLRRLLLESRPDDAEATAQLQQTQLTQPALFAIEYALAQQWISWGVKPQAMIGHSVGEYVAATLAGVFRLEDALSLVAMRGRMIQALPPGAMLIVRLPESEVRPLLGRQLDLAAVNGPSLCVVSGPTDAVAALEATAAARGDAVKRLRTSHAFHSAMMEPMLETFAARVQKVQLSAPNIPFCSSVTGDWITEAQARDPGYWARHVREPVRFFAGVSRLLEEPRPALLEVGPGRTLTQLARQAAPRSTQPAVASLATDDGSGELTAFLGALGELWSGGVTADWTAVHDGAARRRVRLPTYPFERKRFWVDAPAAPMHPAVRPELPGAAGADQTGIERTLRAQVDLMALQLRALSGGN